MGFFSKRTSKKSPAKLIYLLLKAEKIEKKEINYISS